MASETSRDPESVLSVWAQALSIPGAGLSGGSACPLVFELWENFTARRRSADPQESRSRHEEWDNEDYYPSRLNAMGCGL